jgi:hybrid cluster-associated redox disulfide protein
LRRRNDPGPAASDAEGVFRREEGMTVDESRLTQNSTIAEFLAAAPAAARIFIGHKMHCVGCDIAPFETLADACGIYGVGVEEVFAELQRAIAAQEDIR